MSDPGRDVVLKSMAFSVPSRCASCGGPQETTLDAIKRNGFVGGRNVVRSFQIPYCLACSGRVRRSRLRRIGFGAVTFFVALTAAAVGFVAPSLPAIVLIATPTAVAVAVAAFLMALLARAPLPAGTAAAAEAVRLVSFDNEHSVLHCANSEWGEEFASINGAETVAKRRTHLHGAGSLVVAMIVTPIAAGAVWLGAHPQVHVDNATAEALQIWVDGKRSIVVSPNGKGAAPPSMRVAYGKHSLGYSVLGATAPEVSVEAVVTPRKEHLYNPQQSGCYWVVAHAYGHASVQAIAQGPQAVKEFYTFDKVDTWFGANPPSVTVQNGQSGDTRVAVQRAAACMEFASRGCAADVRATLMRCQQAADDDASFDACIDAASSACGFSRSGSGASGGGGVATTKPGADLLPVKAGAGASKASATGLKGVPSKVGRTSAGATKR